MRQIDYDSINSIKRTDKNYYDVAEERFITYEDEQNRAYKNYINRKDYKDEVTKCDVCFWRNDYCDRNGICSKEYPFVKDEHSCLLKIYEEIFEKNKVLHINSLHGTLSIF